LHWVFSGKTLTEAYYETLKERGDNAKWYARSTPQLDSWERLPTLNGITVGAFRRILKSQPGWVLNYWSTEPILSDGRRAREPIFRALRLLFVLPAKMPVLEELFLGRICCDLAKG